MSQKGCQMKIDTNEPCILCGCEQSALLFEKRYPDFKHPGFFSIRKCEGCGLLFNSPRLSNHALAALYDKNYYFFQRSDADEFERIAALYLRTIALIENQITHKKAVEIGSAKGYLLAVLKYLEWQVLGIEISSSAAHMARSKFGVPTFTGTVEQYATSPAKELFSVVLAIDVLEHVSSPVDFFNSIDSILQDGILIIDTPNGSAFNIQTLASEWKGFNPYHIQIFNKDNLTSLLRDRGYSIVNVFSYGNMIEYEQKSEQRGALMAAKSALTNLLAATGVLDKTRQIYHKVKDSIVNRNSDIEKFYIETVKTIEKNRSYFESDDARGELFEEMRGDNIVIIARKGG